MRPWALLPALLLLSLAPRATLAGPRVTLRMGSASDLHETLRGLAAQTGYSFTGQGGMGQPGYKDPATALRKPIEWKNVPLGKALRELGAQFGVTLIPAGPNELWVRTGAELRRAESETADVAVSLPQIQQVEFLRTVGGRDAGLPERRFTFALSVRAPGGDADTLGNLTRLSLLDEAGHEQAVPLEGVLALPRLPDERRISEVTVPWPGAEMGRLRRLEGEIEVYDGARELSLPVALPAPNTSPALPVESVVEGVRIRVVSLAWSGTRVTSRIRLEWSPEAAVVPVSLGPVRLLAKLENGELLRAPSLDATPVEASAGAAELHIVRELPQRARSVEVLVAVRNRVPRRATFRMENVALPFGLPLALRREPLNVRPDLPASTSAPEPTAPPVFRDPRGGVLRLPVPPTAPENGERSLAASLSRKEGAAWTPTRWVELDADETPPRITGLAPGTYRVRLRVTLRRMDGSVQPSPDVPIRTVVIRAGAETEWSSGK